jgi:hypothetical protein
MRRRSIWGGSRPECTWCRHARRWGRSPCA